MIVSVVFELPLAPGCRRTSSRGSVSVTGHDEGRRDDVVENAKAEWHTLNLKRLLPLGSVSYWRTIDIIGKDLCPDSFGLVCRCTSHAILGAQIAKKLRDISGNRFIRTILESLLQHVFRDNFGVSVVHCVMLTVIRARPSIGCVRPRYKRIKNVRSKSLKTLFRKIFFVL